MTDKPRAFNSMEDAMRAIQLREQRRANDAANENREPTAQKQEVQREKAGQP
jgi:hypothetical protein